MTAFSDAHVAPGSSSETRDGAWSWCLESLKTLNASDIEAEKQRLMTRKEESKVAATLMMTALEFLGGSKWLEINSDFTSDLLAPINSVDEASIEPEVGRLLGEGFRVFKVKVGKDRSADIRRVNAILDVLDGRAMISIDANRAYSREDAIWFARRLTRPGIELFEQPCAADAWDDNAAVAGECPVPLMLDEPICGLADIERAAGIENVGFCKVKLKRFGSLDLLAEGIQSIHDHGMRAILGDGLGSEINNWMEAAVASRLIRTRGEFNGFLKHRDRLLLNPLPFDRGSVKLEAGYMPRLDRKNIERLTTEIRVFEY
ncbi:enolase C-terminal domain-like protein [Castellaniella sp. WN]